MGNYNTVTKKAKEGAKNNIPQRKIQSARLPQIKNRFEKIKKISSKRESAQIIDILEEEKFIQNQHMNEKKYIERLESAKHQKNLDTEKKNKENWNNEMIKYKESNENKLKELKKKKEYYQKATDNYFKNSCKDNKIIVDAFDENLSKMGLDMKIIDPKADKLKGKVVSTEIFLKKIREKLEEEEFNRKEQEKRKRRIKSAQLKKPQTLRPLSALSMNTYKVTVNTTPQTAFPGF